MSQVIVPDGRNLHKQKKGTVLTIQNHTENTLECEALSCEQGFGVSKDAPRSDVSGGCKERTKHVYQIKTMYLQKVKCSSN